MKITAEKNALIKAMKDYNSDAISKPQNYSVIDSSCNCAENQVEVLLSFLPEMHQEEVRNDIETDIVNSFMSFCKGKGINIPEKYFEDFFNTIPSRYADTQKAEKVFTETMIKELLQSKDDIPKLTDKLNRIYKENIEKIEAYLMVRAMRPRDLAKIETVENAVSIYDIETVFVFNKYGGFDDFLAHIAKHAPKDYEAFDSKLSELRKE